MPVGPRSGLRDRFAAFTAALIALAAAWGLQSWLGDGVALVVLPAAVAAVAWLAGTAAAVTMAVAGYLACDLLFAGFPNRSGTYDLGTGAELAAYAISCVIIIGFGEALRRSHTREAYIRGLDAAGRRQVKEARSALAAIVEASDDAIISKSLDGIIRSWNPGAERLFGYSAAQAIGQPVTLIVPQELRAEEQSILERLGNGERIENFETVRLTRHGRRVDISLSVSPIVDETGTVVGAAKVARDISQHKRAEAALRASEERFRELANNIDQFAWTCDELGYATWYNRRWYDYTGGTFADMRGNGWKAFLLPDHLERVSAGIEAAVASGTPWEDTFPLRGKDGGYRWFLSRAVPIRDGSGRVVRWFGTNTDVTDRLELEQELVAADRRKDEFLATLAHELRNPLAPIRNALEILNLAGDDPNVLAQARSIIDRQLSHLVRLVDDLLDVSRITRDRLELRRTPTELNALVEQTVASASKPLRRARSDPRGERRAAARADARGPGAAGPGDQQPALQRRPLHAPRRHGPGNRGAKARGGAAPGERHRRRHPARQAHQRVRHVHPGGGARWQPRWARHRPDPGETPGRAARRQRWRRRAKGSARAANSWCTCPSRVAAVTAEPPPTARPAGPSRRVLVVEDNADTAATLSALLSISGHETRVAHDGEEGIKQAESFRPDIVLLDLGLPKMDGIEVCRWIRRQPWGRNITVAALTGWGQQADRRSTEEAGFDRHLVKPVAPDTVLELLAEMPRIADSA